MSKALEMISNPGTCRIPKAGTQCHTLLLAFQRGERLTVGIALDTYHIYALSQRVGDLRGPKYGYWPIKDVTIITPGGAHVSEYFYDWNAKPVAPATATAAPPTVTAPQQESIRQ